MRCVDSRAQSKVFGFLRCFYRESPLPEQHATRPIRWNNSCCSASWQCSREKELFDITGALRFSVTRHKLLKSRIIQKIIAESNSAMIFLAKRDPRVKPAEETGGVRWRSMWRSSIRLISMWGGDIGRWLN